MKCSSCLTNNTQNANFCIGCGKPLKTIHKYYNSGLYGIEDPETKRVFVFGDNHRASLFLHGSVKMFEKILEQLNESEFKIEDNCGVWIPFCNLLTQEEIIEEAKKTPNNDEYLAFIARTIKVPPIIT